MKSLILMEALRYGSMAVSTTVSDWYAKTGVTGIIVMAMLVVPLTILMIATLLVKPRRWHVTKLFFMLLFILGVALFMGGGAFALLAQILLAGRIQVEEALFYLTPVPSPAECAERLGVTAYYHKGEKVFPVG